MGVTILGYLGFAFLLRFDHFLCDLCSRSCTIISSASCIFYCYKGIDYEFLLLYLVSYFILMVCSFYICTILPLPCWFVCHVSYPAVSLMYFFLKVLNFFITMFLQRFYSGFGSLNKPILWIVWTKIDHWTYFWLSPIPTPPACT